MEHFKEQFPGADHGFTPDGAFPIYNVEKGDMRTICLTFSEPEGCRITRLLAGDSRNTIPSRAVIQLKGGEEITYDGISAHSSAPESADNAIIKMCKDREKLYPFNFMKFIDRFLSDCHVPQLKLDDGTEFYTEICRKDHGGTHGHFCRKRCCDCQCQYPPQVWKYR